MNESVLTSIKKLLGIAEDYTQFDADILMHINTVLSILYQMGAIESTLTIEDASTEWTEITGTATDMEMIKSYMHLKVRLLFDPPMSTAVLESMNRMLSELEWRLCARTQ